MTIAAFLACVAVTFHLKLDQLMSVVSAVLQCVMFTCC